MKLNMTRKPWNRLASLTAIDTFIKSDTIGVDFWESICPDFSLKFDYSFSERAAVL